MLQCCYNFVSCSINPYGVALWPHMHPQETKEMPPSTRKNRVDYRAAKRGTKRPLPNVHVAIKTGARASSLPDQQKGKSRVPALTRPVNQPTRNREIIGHFLKEKRQELGLTQQEMLERIGSDAWWSTWSAIERGERNLPPQLWITVAEALGMDKQEFARIMLRYTNPWAFGMIFGFTPTLTAELGAIPRHYVDSPKGI